MMKTTSLLFWVLLSCCTRLVAAKGVKGVQRRLPREVYLKYELTNVVSYDVEDSCSDDGISIEGLDGSVINIDPGNPLACFRAGNLVLKRGLCGNQRGLQEEVDEVQEETPENFDLHQAGRQRRLDDCNEDLVGTLTRVTVYIGVDDPDVIIMGGIVVDDQGAVLKEIVAMQDPGLADRRRRLDDCICDFDVYIWIDAYIGVDPNNFNSGALTALRRDTGRPALETDFSFIVQRADTPTGPTPTNPTPSPPTSAPTRADTPTGPTPTNPTPSPPTSAPAAGGTCFSETATVHVQGKGQIAMMDLQVGDQVFTGSGKDPWEPIYSFGHYHTTLQAEFLQIHTDTDATQPLEITGDHLLPRIVPNPDGGQEQDMVRAADIKVGDILQYYSHLMPQDAMVTKITTVEKHGVFMPLTPTGDIVVDGIKASAYVSIRSVAPTVVKEATELFGMTEESLFHWILAPHRLLCRGVSKTFCGMTEANFNSNDEGILNWLYYMREFAKVVNEDQLGGSVIRVVLLEPLLYLVFGFLTLLDAVLFGFDFAVHVSLTLAILTAVFLKWRNVTSKKL